MIIKYLTLARLPLQPELKKFIFEAFCGNDYSFNDTNNNNNNNIQEAIDVAKTISLKKEKIIPSHEEIYNELISAYKSGCTFLKINDEMYPSFLKNITSAPIVLSVNGDCNILNKNIVAISGTREPEEEDFKIIRNIIDAVSDLNFLTISGLAQGSDCVAHMQSLKSGTIAVMAHGLNMCYPKSHKCLLNKIISNNGAVISEYGFFDKPTKMAFIKRNRLLSAIAISTIIMRAKQERCGTIATAKYAKQFNRHTYSAIFKKGEKYGNDFLLKNNLATPIKDLTELQYNLLMDVVNIVDGNKTTQKGVIDENIKNSSLFDNSDGKIIFNKKNNEMLDYNDLKKQIFLILKQHKIPLITEHNIWNVYFIVKKYIYSNTLSFEDDKSIKKILLEYLLDDVVL